MAPLAVVAPSLGAFLVASLAEVLNPCIVEQRIWPDDAYHALDQDVMRARTMTSWAGWCPDVRRSTAVTANHLARLIGGRGFPASDGTAVALPTGSRAAGLQWWQHWVRGCS
jgi:hypothetical protein